jgi:hypothetical protein
MRWCEVYSSVNRSQTQKSLRSLGTSHRPWGSERPPALRWHRAADGSWLPTRDASSFAKRNPAWFRPDSQHARPLSAVHSKWAHHGGRGRRRKGHIGAAPVSNGVCFLPRPFVAGGDPLQAVLCRQPTTSPIRPPDRYRQRRCDYEYRAAECTGVVGVERLAPARSGNLFTGISRGRQSAKSGSASNTRGASRPLPGRSEGIQSFSSKSFICREFHDLQLHCRDLVRSKALDNSVIYNSD